MKRVKVDFQGIPVAGKSGRGIRKKSDPVECTDSKNAGDLMILCCHMSTYRTIIYHKNSQV